MNLKSERKKLQKSKEGYYSIFDGIKKTEMDVANEQAKHAAAVKDAKLKPSHSPESPLRAQKKLDNLAAKKQEHQINYLNQIVGLN